MHWCKERQFSSLPIHLLVSYFYTSLFYSCWVLVSMTVAPAESCQCTPAGVSPEQHLCTAEPREVMRSTRKAGSDTG